MTPAEKREITGMLKEKFSQYSNFYITNTDALTVAQVNKLRRICFDKNVEMKVAKNTLIRKAMESIDAERFQEVYPSLHGVTALLFSENGKDPAMIISSFRTESKTKKPVLKAAFIDGSVYTGDDQLEALQTLKGKFELIGEVIGLLQSPAQNLMSALNAGSKLASLVKALEDRETA